MRAMHKVSWLLVVGTALAGAVWAQDTTPVDAPIENAPAEAQEVPEQAADTGSADAPAGDESEPFVPPPDAYPHPIERDSDRQPRLVTGGNVLIVGATVHDALAPGRLADVLVVDGKIAAIGEDLIPPEGTLTVEGAGKHLAPGVVDAHSHMAISGGVNEGSVSISAEVDMEDVIDAEDPALYRALAGGCTTIQVLHGSANAIGGQAALLKLRQGNTDDQLVFRGAPKGIKFALGENPKRSNWGSPGERFPGSRLGVEALFHRAFERAREYRAELERYGAAQSRGETPPAPRRDLRLEALVAILEGDLVVHAHSYRADEILMLLRVAEQYGFRVGVLHHVLEGYKVAREIAEHGAGTSTFSDWWAYKIEAYDAVPGNAELLDRAGVLSSIKSDSDELVRHLYHEAAKSVGYSGLDPVRALRLVTLHPAQQLGVGDRVGSIEVGKDADLVLLDGDPLSVHSKVLLTLVDGEVEFERRDAFELDYARADLVGPEFAEPPAPASLEGPVVAIVGATLHTVENGVIENGTLLIQGGRIAALGASVAVPADAERIDATGKHLYPGLVALDTTLGLREIDSIRATVDTQEDGGNQPDVRVSASLHADSAHIAVTRERGITVAQSAPRGRGPMLGQSAVLALEGDTWEELLLMDRDMLHVRVPGVPNTAASRRGRTRGDATTSDKELATLELAFAAAVEYERLQRERAANDAAKQPYDARLTALVPYATGQKTVALHAQNAATLLRAVEFAAKTKIRAVIYGAAEGWKVADAIAAAGIPVVVGPVTTLPTSEYDPYDAPYANAAVLSRAGVQVAIGAGNDDNPRNLGFHAGFAAAYGLTPAAALEAVTLAPARILGLGAELGSLAVGKRADLVLSNGDILEPTTRVEGLWIQGRQVELASRQTQLYERFERRYESGGGR